MLYPNTAAERMYQDAQLRTLYACFGFSIALHGLAMISFPGLRSPDRPADERVLTAMFASRSEPSESTSPARAARPPRERQVSEPEVPLKPVEPVPVPMAKAEEPAAVAPTQASAPPAVPVVPSDSAPVEARASTPAEAVDASLLEAYRLALIDAAKRYKRYPVQAMERGWEGRVEIRVVVDANGMIKSALVKRSSRYQVLDDQALDMVRKAFNALAQVRPAPRGSEFTVDVPVIFELQTG
jgi:periplasmic protein TonB